MKLWAILHRSTSRAFHAKYEKIHDEERLRADSRPGLRPRPSNHRVGPIKIAPLLLLVDLVILGLLLYTFEPLITLLRRNKELFGPRVALPSSPVLFDRNHTAQSSKIPLILHQTTPKEMIPDRWVESQKSCKRAYSGFEYKVNLSTYDYMIELIPYL